MSGIYKNGKKVVDKVHESSRMEFIGAFLGDLFKSLDDFNARLGVIPVPNNLQNLLADYANYILKFLLEYPTSSGRVAAKKKQGFIKALGSRQSSFDESFRKFEYISPETVQVVLELNESVLWFIDQHTKAVNSYVPGRPLPIKPTDWNGREFFEQEVKKHQITHGQKKYPRYKHILEKMEAQGFKLSPRTYGNWKRLFESGELWNYFPSKK